MAAPPDFLLGEFARSMDERFRLSIPPSLAEPLLEDGPECILAKERPGCLSLWNAADWKERLDAGVELVRGKMRAGKLEGRLDEVQRLGRLLSTRHREVPITGRGRLLIPEGFRELLAVEPGGDVIVVGAAVCLELWSPAAWADCLAEQIPEFRQLLDGLAG